MGSEAPGSPAADAVATFIQVRVWPSSRTPILLKMSKTQDLKSSRTFRGLVNHVAGESTAIARIFEAIIEDFLKPDATYGPIQ
jgi:hypothetical protein